MNQLMESTQDTRPWWKYGMVWMIIAGPAIVVVAGFVTLWLAISTPDPLVSNDYYREGLEINKKLRMEREHAATSSGSWEPAHQARNHAATGGVVPAPAGADSAPAAR